MARGNQVDLMMAMNIETYARDVRDVRPGGFLLYDSTWPRSATCARRCGGWLRRGPGWSS